MDCYFCWRIGALVQEIVIMCSKLLMCIGLSKSRKKWQKELIMLRKSEFKCSAYNVKLCIRWNGSTSEHFTAPVTDLSEKVWWLLLLTEGVGSTLRVVYSCSLVIFVQIDKYPTMILYQTDDRIGEFTGVRDVESLHLFVENSRRQRDEL